MTRLAEPLAEGDETEPSGKQDYTPGDKRRRYAGRRRKQLLEDEVKIRLELAHEYILHGEPEKALNEYDAIVRRAPRHVDTLLNRGRLCEDLGLLNRAIQDYHKALDLDPTNVTAYEFYCEALEKWDKSEEPEELAHLENKHRRPPLKTAAYQRSMADKLLGWPGHRTRLRRLGQNPVRTKYRMLHLDGIYIRRLFTGEAFRKKGCLAKFEIFLGIVGLIVLVGGSMLLAVLLLPRTSWMIFGIVIWTLGIMLVLWLFEQISNKYGNE